MVVDGDVDLRVNGLDHSVAYLELDRRGVASLVPGFFLSSERSIEDLFRCPPHEVVPLSGDVACLHLPFPIIFMFFANVNVTRFSVPASELNRSVARGLCVFHDFIREFSQIADSDSDRIKRGLNRGGAAQLFSGRRFRIGGS